MCLSLSLSLSLSLRAIKKGVVLELGLFAQCNFVENNRRFYICKTKSGEVRNYKIWIKILILININVNSKIIKKGFRDLRR